MFHVKQFRMNNHKHILTTKDFLVTGDTFEISKNLETGILETLPKPNQSDLHKYYDSKDYISHNQKPSSFFSFCYRQIRSISTSQKIKICRKQLDQKDLKKEVRVLDVGCGAGYFLIKCLEKGWIVKGVENNKNAKKILPPEISKHVFEDLEALKSHPEKYDIITMWHSLEHLHDLNSSIQDMKKLLRPNGTIVVACPNHKSFDAIFYKENWAAYDVPRHLWHFDKKSMRDLFSLHNVQLIKTFPMYWDSFFVSILSEKILRNPLPFVRGLTIGLISNIKAKISGEYSSIIYTMRNKT